MLTPSSAFIQPYPQSLLGGRLGLNTQDIAIILGTNHFNLKRKIDRMSKKHWGSMGWDLKSYDFKLSRERGRAGTGYQVVTELVKVILARWNSEIGDGYLSYLIGCQRVVENTLPKVEKILKEQASKIEALELIAAKKKKRRKGSGLVKVVTKTTTSYDLFGNPVTEVRYEEKRYSDLEEQELRLQKIRHRSKVLKGLQEKQDNDINSDYDKQLAKLKASKTGVLRLIS